MAKDRTNAEEVAETAAAAKQPAVRYFLLIIFLCAFWASLSWAKDYTLWCYEVYIANSSKLQIMPFYINFCRIILYLHVLFKLPE